MRFHLHALLGTIFRAASGTCTHAGLPPDVVDPIVAAGPVWSRNDVFNGPGPGATELFPAWAAALQSCVARETHPQRTHGSEKRQAYWRCWHIIRWARVGAAAKAMYAAGGVSANAILGLVTVADFFEATARSETEPFDPRVLADRVLNGPVAATTMRIALKGRWVEFPSRLAITFGREMLVNELRIALSSSRHAVDSFDTVVELGAGWSANLFHIMLAIPGLRRGASFNAGEYSAGGRDLGTLIAGRSFADVAYSSFPFDYNKPMTAASSVKRGKRCLVYTCHSIEQIHRVPARIVDAMLSCGDEVFGFHFEPINFQLPQNSTQGPLVKEVEAKSAITSNHYNANLVSVLQAAERKGKIKILGWESDVWRHGSLIFWEKVVAK
jgi:hypothetical protein